MMMMTRLSCYPIVHCLIALPTPPFDFEASSLVRFSFDDISNGEPGGPIVQPVPSYFLEQITLG